MHGDDRPPSAPDAEQRDRRELVGRALNTYREKMTSELAGRGDAGAIKRLYIGLGERLGAAVGEDVEQAPVFSYPEIGPAVASLTDKMQGRILDAGCGPYPIHSVLLGDHPRRTVTSLDISHGTVLLATRIADRLGLRILGVVGDVEALPFKDDVFDGAICGDTIEHLPNDRAGIQELDRVLRATGRLVIATPNRVRFDVLLRRCRDRIHGISRADNEYFESESHIREYTWRDLRRTVEARFRVRGSVSVGWDGGWKKKAATFLVRYWPLRCFSRVVVLELEPRRAAR